MQMNVPWTGWDFKTRPITIGIRSGCVLLETMTGVELKGAFYPTRLSDGSDAVLFVGSPRVHTLSELEVRDYFSRRHQPQQPKPVQSSCLNPHNISCLLCGMDVQRARCLSFFIRPAV
jgi:hypothetical protein